MSRVSIPITEAQAERSVVELFEWHGCEVRRIREDIHNKGGYGLPDLLITATDLQLWVEMKRPPSRQNPRGRARKKQKETLIAWRLRRIPCCVGDGIDALRHLAFMASNATDFLPSEILAECDAIMAEYDWWPA